MPRNSEYRVYDFIGRSLKDIGWDIRNPSRFSGGEVYTQNEASQHPELKKCLGRLKPENVIKVDENIFWVIEAKAEHNEINQAVSEAQKDYGDLINKNSDKIKCLFATGVAGSSNETYLVETYFFNNGQWERVKINDFDTTGFISREQARKIIETKESNIKNQEISEELFISKANDINEILHKGAINKKNRARVIASLLLALVKDEYLRISDDPTTLIEDINSRVKSLLRSYNKENFAQEIAISLPTSRDNHIKNRRALVDCIQELRNLNIKSAINSGTDLLGQFYEIFLKYANDAKEIGIVLTPRHITQFASQILNITEKDYIFDPTCGTGGFLVSAFDLVKKNYPRHTEDFKNSHIYGIEQDPEIVALALVNMIFRGDGNSNIYEGNSLDNRFVKVGDDFKKIKNIKDSFDPNNNFITRVLMNPPFAQDEEEYVFVDHALSQMTPNGLLFAVVPTSTMTSTSNGRNEITWRSNMLKRHTLKAVIKLSDELFQPNANKGTYGIIIEAWKPHEEQEVFWAIMDDGFTMKKAKRLPSENLPSNMNLISDTLKNFLAFGTKVENIPKIMGFSKIVFDEYLDCGAEAYIDDSMGNNINISSTTSNLLYSLMLQKDKGEKKELSTVKYQVVPIDDIFESIVRGDTKPLSSINFGDIPVITTQESDNGIAGYYDVGKATIYSDMITISANGSSCKAFYHPYKFSANPDVLVCKVKEKYNDLEIKMFIASAINQSGWRFSYYRKCTQQKLRKDVQISLPVKNNGEIDKEYIKDTIRKTVGFNELKEYLETLPV